MRLLGLVAAFRKYFECLFVADLRFRKSMQLYKAIPEHAKGGDLVILLKFEGEDTLKFMDGRKMLFRSMEFDPFFMPRWARGSLFGFGGIEKQSTDRVGSDRTTSSL